MFLWKADGDGTDLVIGLLLGTLIGVFAGAVPLTIGLLRGHKSMAWTGFAISALLGAGCMFGALVPALIFTCVVAFTEPIEKRRARKRRSDHKRKRRRERADDMLDDDEEYEVRQRRHRRSRDRADDDDDEDVDRPRPRHRGDR